MRNKILHILVVVAIISCLFAVSCSETRYYQIRFNSNGGSEVPSQNVKSGDTAVEPSNPKKANYAFGGWFVDQELNTKFDFGMKITREYTLYAKWVGGDKLTFKANKPFEIRITATDDDSKAWDKTIEYSKDLATWYEWNGDTVKSGSDNVLYFRGTNNTYVTGGDGSKVWTIKASDGKDLDLEVSCTGNIMTIMDYKNPDNVTMAANSFMNMFVGCTCLVKAPELCALELSNYCYNNMFAGCTKLEEAPELPSEYLHAGCYLGMFVNCVKITRAPKLRATILANNCYESMFSGCTGLVAAPELPALITTQGCYKSMFNGCVKLVVPPTLPASTLYKQCYMNMFNGCVNLASAPVLEVKNLVNATTTADDDAEGCYWGMFEGCVSLTDAPALPAMVMVKSCYKNMFKGCVGLKETPALPAKDRIVDEVLTSSLAEGCYEGMFEGCTGVSKAPVLASTKLAVSCYKNMFADCVNLTSAPVLPATTLVGKYTSDSNDTGCYSGMFKGCSSLNTVTAKFTSWDSDSSTAGDQCATTNWLKGTAIAGTFVCPVGIAVPAVGDRSGSNIPKNWDVANMILTVDNYVTFSSSAPFAISTVRKWTAAGKIYYSQNLDEWKEWDGSKIISGDSNELYFIGTGNTQISATASTAGSYAAWAITNGDGRAYTGPGVSCSGNIMALLDYTNKNRQFDATNSKYCFAHMFDGCKALISAPELPAITLSEGCYESMFAGCTNLMVAPTVRGLKGNSATAKLPSTSLAIGCYKNMFNGCTSLTVAPELPATDFSNDSKGYYSGMFQNCSNLKVVKVGLNSWGTGNTTNWLDGVSSEGTFTCPSGLSMTTRDASHVPSGWTVITSLYTVEFNSQGGSGVTSQSVPMGGLVTKPGNPTYSGWVFAGWYKEAACENAWNFALDTVVKDTTLFAKWVAKVTYNPMGAVSGNVPTDRGVYNKGDKIVVKGNIGDLTKTGYEFVGWTAKSDGKGLIYNAGDTYTVGDDGNVTFYAKWGVPGTVAYNKGTGTTYSSLQDAVNGVSDTDLNVILLKDVRLVSTNDAHSTVVIDKELTLDLNGHTISSNDWALRLKDTTPSDENTSKKVTVKDGTIKRDETLGTLYDHNLVTTESMDADFENVRIVDMTPANLKMSSGGSIYIGYWIFQAAIYEGTSNPTPSYGTVADVKFTNCEFVMRNVYTMAQSPTNGWKHSCAVIAQNGAKIKLNDCTVDSDRYGIGAWDYGGEVTIDGGRYTSKENVLEVVHNGAMGSGAGALSKISVTSGRFDGGVDKMVCQAPEKAQFEFTGGVFTNSGVAEMNTTVYLPNTTSYEAVNSGTTQNPIWTVRAKSPT